MERKLSVAIVGGSGACGRELIIELNKNPSIGKIIIFTRRILPEWETFLAEPNTKLNIQKVETLDNMRSWSLKLIEGVDTSFCCLGGRTKNGDAEFYKTDYTYYVEFAEYSKAAGVPHFSVISSKGADTSSWFYYFKVKGQADEAIMKLGFPFVSIFRPGFLLNRRNDSRFGESLFGIIPFMDKIETKVLADKMTLDCLNYHLKQSVKPTGSVVYPNNEILKIKSL